MKLNIFSIQDDINLGRKLSNQISSNPQEYPVLDNPEIKNYVQSIVDEILKAKDIKHKKEFAYKVEIIDKNIINAFCAPGGYIYVYTGLLQFLDYEASLAGVIAHEIAHAEMRHSTQRMTKQYGVTALMDILNQNNASNDAKLATNLFSGMGLMYNSREDEYESDEYSFKYLRNTKWYPGGIKYFFDKCLQMGDQNDFQLLFSTHPLSKDRYDKVTQMLKKHKVPPPNEENLLYRNYQKMKEKLRPNA